MKDIKIGKSVQLILLIGYTAFVLCVTLLVEGRRGAGTNLAPFDEVERVYARLRGGEVFSQRVLFGIWGIAGNFLLFAPWSFIAWKFLDGNDRSALRNHVDVLILGLLFVLGIEGIQLFLPTRVADIDDILLNLAGTLAGASLAHLGREFRAEWVR